MWMDVAQEAEPDNRSDDEDTVFDRNSESIGKNPFEHEAAEARGMLEESDTRCGIGNWRPHFLQDFSSKKIFTVIFILTGTLQGATWAYFTSTMSTMEKRFKMSSETSGALLAGNELAQLIISIILSYYGIKSKRMKFVTIGVALLAISCFLFASPQIFFGSGKYALSLAKPQEDIHFTGSKYESENNVVDHGVTLDDLATNKGVDSGLMENENESIFTEELVTFPYGNDLIAGSVPLCLRDVELITNQSIIEYCSVGESGSSFPISILFIAQMISGAGTMLFLSSGGPYTEDILMPNQLPIVFGITLALRLIGPFLGYILASAFLRSFISTVSTPNINQEDARWMGAWWLGWFVLGGLMSLMAFIIGLFPRQMAREVLKKRSVTTDTGSSIIILPGSALYLGTAELKIANVLPIAPNFLKTFMVLFNNKINVFITLSTVFHIFVGIGYWSFLPKYLEVMFHESSYEAAMLTGSISIVFQAAGLLSSGVIISKFMPNAGQVSMWNVILTFLQILVLITLTQFGCDHGDVTFGHKSMTPTTTTTTLIPPQNQPTISTATSLQPSESVLNSTTISSIINSSIRSIELISPTTTETSSLTMTHLFSNCSADCVCEMGPMIPLCDEDTGRLFYSPCHAGCEQVFDNGTVFADCSCVSENSTLTKGFCQGHEGCFAGYATFSALTAITQFLFSTGIIGKMLIFYRSVAPEGRSLVISLSLLFISVFAILPSPIFFGSIIDSACHIWENTCAGRAGNCWLYNNKTLRYAFNLAAAGFLLLGGAFDILLWRKVKAKDVRLYDGDIDHIPKPSSSSGNQYGYEDDKPRTRISSNAYS